MATRIEEILIRARDTLADPLQERWSDARLLRLVDDAQKSIVLHANYLRTKVQVPLLNGQADYQLGSIVHKLTRVLNEQQIAVPLLSHVQADKLYGVRWELAVGPTVLAIVYDKLDANWFKVYPIPDAALASTIVPTTPFYGVGTSGLVQADAVSSPYGVVTGFEVQSTAFLTVSVLTNPVDILAATDVLQLNSVFDTAIKFYVTGMALRDSKDAQDRQTGNEELGFYQVSLRQAIKDGAQDFTGSRTQYDADYGRVI